MDTSPNRFDVGKDRKDLFRGESFGAHLPCAGAHDLLPVSVQVKAVMDRRTSDDSQNSPKSSQHIRKKVSVPTLLYVKSKIAAVSLFWVGIVTYSETDCWL